MDLDSLLLRGNTYMLEVCLSGHISQATDKMRYSLEFRYLGHFGELKNNGMLQGVCGYGDILDEAANDYYQKIKGKTLVFAAYSACRREIVFE